MSQIARIGVKLVSGEQIAYSLPAALAVNTLLLLGLDSQGMLPEWIRTAAALFLAF